MESNNFALNKSTEGYRSCPKWRDDIHQLLIPVAGLSQDHLNFNQSYYVETQKGRMGIVFGNTRFYVYNGSQVSIKSTESLEIGSYVLMPRKLTVENHDAKSSELPIKLEDFYQSFNPRVVAQNPSFLRDLISKLSNQYGSQKALASYLQIHSKTLSLYKTGVNFPPYSIYKQLCQLGSFAVSILPVKAERQSKIVILPQCITREFAELLGYILADGMLKGKSGVYFFNNDNALRKRFSSLSKKIFGIDTKEKVENTVKTSYFNNKLIYSFLQWIGIPNKQKSNTLHLPGIVKYASNDIICSFLNAYIAGDGSFYNYTTEISTASKRMGRDLCYVLMRLGIIFRYREKSTCRIFIEGVEVTNLARHLRSEFPHQKLRQIIAYSNAGISHFRGTNLIPLDSDFLAQIPRASFKHDKRAV